MGLRRRRGLACDGTLTAEAPGLAPRPGRCHARVTPVPRSSGLCTVPIAAAVALCLLPLLIGRTRRARELAAVAVVNSAFGWMFVGWIVDLATTFRTALPPPLVSAFQPTPPVTAARPVPGWLGPGDPPRRPPDTAPPLVLPPWPGPHEGTRGT